VDLTSLDALEDQWETKSLRDVLTDEKLDSG
jgi:hypothetical protein